MPNTCIILNPWGGRGTAGQQRNALETALRACDVSFVIRETRARGEATVLAMQALAQGFDQVVAAGGDGTINEVVNGMMRSRARNGTTAALGIVPLGTGSDFVKVLDGVVPNDLAGAARRLAVGKTRAIDVGVANGRFFINGMGLGLDAQVAVETHRIKRLKGLAVYLMAVARALARYRAYPMTVRFGDTEVQQEMLFASVANGRCQGGAFWMTPDALIDDGLLDVCLVERMHLGAVIRNIPHLMRGTHTRLHWVTIGRAARISIDCAGPLPLATDGEVITTDTRHVAIEVHSHALQVIIS